MAKRKERKDGVLQPCNLQVKETIDSRVSESNSTISDVEAHVQTALINSRAIFVLENASLKKGFVRNKRKILNANEDTDFLKKQGENLNDYRPDIFYESLRAILDSPLNKAGMVGAIYVKTDSDVVFQVKPHTRIPRTFKRFSGLMLELLEKSRVSAKDTGEVLIQLLKEPLTSYIPKNANVIGLSFNSEKVVDIEDYLAGVDANSDLVFVVGATVNGSVSKDSKDDYISVSDYPLSAKYCLGLICEALEQKWDIF